MSYLVTLEIWGPETGSELGAGAMAGDAEEAVRACASRVLDHSLPGASVTRVVVSVEEREWNGRARLGHHVTVVIQAPEPPGLDGERDGRWLRFWIESEVSVALLELINPMRVEGVSVTPVAGERIERR